MLPHTIQEVNSFHFKLVDFIIKYIIRSKSQFCLANIVEVYNIRHQLGNSIVRSKEIHYFRIVVARPFWRFSFLGLCYGISIYLNILLQGLKLTN